MSVYPEKAPIVIDGANVAYAYGSGGQFQLRGILLSVAYFQRLRHAVIVILPPKYRLKCERDEDDTADVLKQLRDDNVLSFAPGGSNDDDFIIQRAVKTGAFILSCDKYEEEKRKHPEWKAYVENYRLNFTFVNGDDFTPNPTPLGPYGPTLKQFLNRRPRPLADEAHMLDAVSKSNQQLLSEIIRVSRQRASDSSASASQFRNAHQKDESITFASTNQFQALCDQYDHQKIDSQEESKFNCSMQESTISLSSDAGEEASPILSAVVDCNGDASKCEPQKNSNFENESKSKSKSEAKEITEEESPFQQIVTGCGTVIETGSKHGLIRVDETYGKTKCKLVEFYPYACLGSILEEKSIIECENIEPTELMNRFPVGTEVAFAAAFIEELYASEGSASALQICLKNNLLDGYGHCDYESIFADHAFLVSRSGQLHWSPCCDSSILLFRSAFVDELKKRRLDKIVNCHDWIEYKSMPTPAVGLFDTCPIVVKANFLKLTGLIVKLTNDYGIIRSARVNDNIAFRNTGNYASRQLTNEILMETSQNERKRQLKIGDWVRFRIRKNDPVDMVLKKKSGPLWRATNLEIVEKPDCVLGDVVMEECFTRMDYFQQKRKSGSGTFVLKITAIGHTGAIKSQQGVLWCESIGRVHVDPHVLINIDLSLHPPGTLVKFDAVYQPQEKRHQRKDTVWYATSICNLTKNERKRHTSNVTMCKNSFNVLYCTEEAVVDFYDSERRWAGLHGLNSRYVLYDRYDDVVGRENGRMKPGETVKVTYVTPPIDSPLYVAIAVQPSS